MYTTVMGNEDYRDTLCTLLQWTTEDCGPKHWMTVQEYYWIIEYCFNYNVVNYSKAI